MSPMTSTAAAPVVDLPSRAKAVAAIADEYGEIADREGHLSPPVVDALHREGLFGMWVPRSIRGGAELDPVSSLEVLEHVSYGDPSAGWVLMASALAIGTGAAYPRRRGGRGAVRRRAPAGDRRTGHAAGHGDAQAGRLPPERLVELCLRHQARARTSTRWAWSRARASRASSCCRSGRRRSSTTGTCWACAPPGSIDYRSTTCSCPRRTRTSR